MPFQKKRIRSWAFSNLQKHLLNLIDNDKVIISKQEMWHKEMCCSVTEQYSEKFQNPNRISGIFCSCPRAAGVLHEKVWGYIDSRRKSTPPEKKKLERKKSIFWTAFMLRLKRPPWLHEFCSSFATTSLLQMRKIRWLKWAEAIVHFLENRKGQNGEQMPRFAVVLVLSEKTDFS